MADWYKTSLSVRVPPTASIHLHHTVAGPHEMDEEEEDLQRRKRPPVSSLSPTSSLSFRSRRSCVLSRHAMVASSQPLASAAGLDFLRRGANAADAALVMAAILAVTEPCSTGVGSVRDVDLSSSCDHPFVVSEDRRMARMTLAHGRINRVGDLSPTINLPHFLTIRFPFHIPVNEPTPNALGGDMFCLFYQAANRTVACINGSGRSPVALTMDVLRQHCSVPLPTPSIEDPDSPHPPAVTMIDTAVWRDSVWSITVPGAAQGWQDLYDRHGSGRFSFAALLEPAAMLADEGFPVSAITAYHWNAGMSQITQWFHHDDAAPSSPTPIPFTVPETNAAPREGEIFRNPDLARVLRELGSHGAQAGFYRGPTGEAMVEAVARHSGVLTLDDLYAHTTSDFPTPIAANYRDHLLWQIPPNGQGVAALVALAGLEYLEQNGQCARISPDTVGTADALHVLTEMMRLGFADAREYVSDPACLVQTPQWLVDPQRIGARAIRWFDPHKAVVQGTPDFSSDTISFQVVDTEGNAISFVNSNFMGFGTGLVPRGCGFSLQNRGFGFSLDEGHPNVLGPSKRPYHTIIPGIITHADTNELYATISNMGGNMQPQGHLQLTVNMIAGGHDPQTAIDQPRFCIVDGTHNGTIFLEEGVPDGTIEELRMLGHDLKENLSGHDRSIFGRAQIVKRDRKTGVLWGGSDGRADGCAIGY